MPERHSPHAPALAFLRTAVGWSQARLARFFGLGKEDISKYERGDKALTRETLDFLAEPIAPPEAVDVLLFAHRLIYPETQEADSSPVALTPEEIQATHRAVMAGASATGRIAAESLWSELSRRKRQEKIEAARREAEALFQRLTTVTSEERKALVKVFPVY